MHLIALLGTSACVASSLQLASGFIQPSPSTCAASRSLLALGAEGPRGGGRFGGQSDRQPSRSARGGPPRRREGGGGSDRGGPRLPREFAGYGNEGVKSGFMRNQPSGDKEYLDDDFDLDELLDGMDEEDVQASKEKKAGKPSGVRAWEGDKKAAGGAASRAYDGEKQTARGAGARTFDAGPSTEDSRGPRQPRRGATEGEKYRITRRNTDGRGAPGSVNEEDDEEEEGEEGPMLSEEEEEERQRWEYYESLELEPIEYVEETFGEPVVERLSDQFFFSKKAFAEIGATEEAITAVENMGLSRPSKIQTIAYPHVLAGTSCVIAEQTGSGKTLAYILPLLQRLRTLEVEAGLGRAASRSPRAIILAPTAELAAQVTSVARSVTRHMPLRVICVTGGASAKTQKRMLDEGVDVVIGTPGRVQYLIDEGMVRMKGVQTVVLDEVDVLFLDDSFDLSTLGATTPASAQFLFVTATLPVPVADQISREFPGVKKLLGPGLHKIAPQVEEVLVDCSGPEEEERREETAFVRKRDMMVQNLLKRPVDRTLVFCNSIPSCRRVENALKRADRRNNRWRVLPYHSALAPAERAKSLEMFSKASPKQPVILVCTDRTSRGVDFENADVEHVLLFDFPRDPSEYLRRVGRTGRAGRIGRVTALVLGKQVALARGIMSGNKKGERVHPVPAN